MLGGDAAADEGTRDGAARSDLLHHHNLAEASIVIGYPFKDGENATVEIGSDKFSFFTKADGAWLQAKAEEKRLIDAMRAGAEMTVKGLSKRGTLTTDTYSLKGISNALDKVAEGCK